MMRKQQPQSAGPSCAVVLAAGAGTRLRSANGSPGTPKPLTLVLGIPLIVRTLASLGSQGVREAVVVTGYGAEAVQGTLERESRLNGLRLRFAHNGSWSGMNGVSVLAARHIVGDRPFFLSMGDHLYGYSLLRRLAAHAVEGAALTLAVDYRRDPDIDLDDAVRARVDASSLITAIGKGLQPFDAVDTGVFVTGPLLFDALEEERRERGDCSLVHGVARLARQGLAAAVDIDGAWWQDVDTQTDLQAAEAKLRAALARELEPAL